MLLELRINNCMIFNKEVTLSLQADMRSRRFGFNVHSENGFNALKTAAIYGPNNTGKTCLINILAGLKAIILNKRHVVLGNFFNSPKADSCIGVTFLEEGHTYAYEITINHSDDGQIYPFEKFSEVYHDKAGRLQEDIWMLRDTNSSVYESKSENLKAIMPILGNNNLMMYLANTEQISLLSEMKRILISFANKIEVIPSSMFSLSKTLNLMKEHPDERAEIVDFIRNADLHLENIRYDEKSTFADKADYDTKYQEMLKLTSRYNGVDVPSILWDSEGTKRMEMLAGYIIEALHQDKILVIDELDTSLHFKLTRAIVAMFNSEVNEKSQLIFSTHDVSLLDCRKLFRKEQIWFTNKDTEQVYLYPLSMFTTAEYGLRGDTSDIAEKYRKGLLGALPDPQLVTTLIKVKKKKENADA